MATLALEISLGPVWSHRKFSETIFGPGLYSSVSKINVKQIRQLFHGAFIQLHRINLAFPFKIGPENHPLPIRCKMHIGLQ